MFFMNISKKYLAIYTLYFLALYINKGILKNFRYHGPLIKDNIVYIKEQR